MADLNNLDKQPASPAVPVPDKKRKADVGLDEEPDNVADFLEVRVLPAIKHRQLNSLPAVSPNLICIDFDSASALLFCVRRGAQRCPHLGTAPTYAINHL